MGDIAPQVPLAIDAVRSGTWPLDRRHGRARRVRLQLARAVHDSGPGLHQQILSEGIRLVCRVDVEGTRVLKAID
jgi:hypothetical protein